jgi:hypothetical protein
VAWHPSTRLRGQWGSGAVKTKVHVIGLDV